MSTLRTDFCGLEFQNPFIVAASPSSDSREKVRHALEAGFGGIVFKTTSIPGYPVELVHPNMMGLSYMRKRQAALCNIDLISERNIEIVCEDIRCLKNEYPDRMLIGSIMAGKKEDWGKLVVMLEQAGADCIECSMSCPQGDDDDRIPVTDAQLTEETTKWIKNAVKASTPVIVKLSSSATDIVEIAKAAKRGGADAVCAIDTVRAFAGVDVETMVPKMSVNGKSTWCGLSGPAVKPIALGCVSRIAKGSNIEISGCGGISNWQDAVEFMLLGSKTVQICTAVSFYGFRMIKGLCSGLLEYMDRHNFSSPADITGKSLPKIVEYDRLDKQYSPVCKIEAEKCARDRLCYTACADAGHGAISIDGEGYPKVDKSLCRGCGICQSVCRKECISIVDRKCKQ